MSSDPLIDMLADLREEDAIATVTSRLAAGEDHLQILESCRSAMAIVGQRFQVLPDFFLNNGADLDSGHGLSSSGILTFQDTSRRLSGSAQQTVIADSIHRASYGT